MNAFTVDLEEWFHICGAGGRLAPANWDALPSRVVANTRDLLALLETCGVSATFFVVGWVADRHPELIADIQACGHEIGAHSFAHRRVYELSPDAFAEDLDRNLRALRAAGVATIRGFRAPEWSINDRSLWALDTLVRKGFAFDSSMTPLRLIGNPSYPHVRHTRATPHGPIEEFPPLVGRRLGQNVPLGGGWGLRLSRPRTVIREIEKRNSLGQGTTLFVHPWEIDDDPPRALLGPAAHFVHYAGLGGFRHRLAEVLRRVPFGPMHAAL